MARMGLAFELTSKLRLLYLFFLSLSKVDVSRDILIEEGRV